MSRVNMVEIIDQQVGSWVTHDRVASKPTSIQTYCLLLRNMLNAKLVSCIIEENALLLDVTIIG